jgi:hypothetical protein
MTQAEWEALPPEERVRRVSEVVTPPEITLTMGDFKQPSTISIVCGNEVGHYDLGDIKLHPSKRPNWIQQQVARWCLGWTWHDK